MDNIVGQSIVDIRPMTEAELNEEGWDPAPYQVVMVIELENGVKLYPSSDGEGNNGGVLFGVDVAQDFRFSVYPPREEVVNFPQQ
tara:strand:- start:17030 stop:17284 length:255 start_codon:yes stop_codon:yes gene_type:complete